jgi:hypothetical protein
MNKKAIFKEIARWLSILILGIITIISMTLYETKKDDFEFRKRVGVSTEDTTDLLTIDNDIIQDFEFDDEQGWSFDYEKIGTETGSSSGINTGIVTLYPESAAGSAGRVYYDYIIEDLDIVFPFIVRGPKYIITIETMVFYDGDIFVPYEHLQYLAVLLDGEPINSSNSTGVKNTLSFIVDTSIPLIGDISIRHLLQSTMIRNRSHEVLYNFNITTWGITQNAEQEEYIEMGRQEVINNPNEYNLYTPEQYNEYGQLKYNEGYDNGTAFGESIGYQNGVREGYMDGYEDGYNAGYEVGEYDGEQNGYNAGYQTGYNDGRIEASPIGLEWFKSSIDVLGSFLEIQLLPNVPIGSILSGFTILVLLKWILAWFRG